MKTKQSPFNKPGSGGKKNQGNTSLVKSPGSNKKPFVKGTPNSNTKQGMKNTPNSNFKQGMKNTPNSNFKQGMKNTPNSNFKQGMKNTPNSNFKQGMKNTPKGNQKSPNAKSPVGNKPPGSGQKAVIDKENKPVASKKPEKDEDTESESFDEDDSDFDEEELKKMVSAKIFKAKEGKLDDDDEGSSFDEADFDDLEDSEEDEDEDDEDDSDEDIDDDDSDSKKEAAKVSKPAQPTTVKSGDVQKPSLKRKLGEEDSSNEDDSEDDVKEVPQSKKPNVADLKTSLKRKLDNSDSDEDDIGDDEMLKAMLEESSDEDSEEEAKKKSDTPQTKKQKVEIPNKNKPTPPAKSDADEVPSGSIVLPTTTANMQVTDKDAILKLITNRLGDLKNRSIVVSPMPQKVTHGMLKELKKEMSSCTIPMHRRKGNCKGYAFIEFKTPSLAQKYINLVKGKLFAGKPLTAVIANKPVTVKHTIEDFDLCTLYVCNLPRETTKADIKYIFPDAKGIDFPKTKDNSSMGHTKVTFADSAKALSNFETKHGTTLRGEKINVNFHLVPKSDGKSKQKKSPAPKQGAVKKTDSKKVTKKEDTNQKPKITLAPLSNGKKAIVTSESDSETEETLTQVKDNKMKMKGQNKSDVLSKVSSGKVEKRKMKKGKGKGKLPFKK